MKKLTALVIVVALLVACSGYALAAMPPIQGQPDQFRPGDSRGIFVWRDNNGLHVRTTTRGREHVFSGVIRTDGHISGLRGVGQERNDFNRVSRDGDAITFRFHTAGGVDGFDFWVKGGDRLTLDLFMDGHWIDTRSIYVGRRGWHPDSSEFTLRR